MSIDIIADAREWLSQQDTRPRTHCDRCHLWHPVCLVSRLVHELSRSGQPEAKTRDFDADCPARDNAAPAAIACGSDRNDKPAPRPAGTGDTPTLTAQEREAISFLLRHAAVAADDGAFADSADYRMHHDAVFGLLDRTSDGGNRQ
jgi:hypothetical protein